MNNLGHAAALVKVSLNRTKLFMTIQLTLFFSFFFRFFFGFSSQNLILSFHWIFDDVEAVEEDDSFVNDTTIIDQEPSLGEGSIQRLEEVETEEREGEGGGGRDRSHAVGKLCISASGSGDLGQDR